MRGINGVYVKVERPYRLSFTWRWDDSDHDTLVDVRMTEDAGKTTVSIIHTKLVDQAEADIHAEGWTGCLASLAALYTPRRT